MKRLGYVLVMVQWLAVTSVMAFEDGTHGHEYHANTIFGFVGITGEDRRDRALTVAAEYERRISERWGISAGLEHALGDLNFTLLTVPVVFHHGNWGFYAGPGLERHDGSDEFLVRFGVLYEFEKGELILAPKFTVDVIDGEAVLVGGLAIGFGF